MPVPDFVLRRGEEAIFLFVVQHHDEIGVRPALFLAVAQELPQDAPVFRGIPLLAPDGPVRRPAQVKRREKVLNWHGSTARSREGAAIQIRAEMLVERLPGAHLYVFPRAFQLRRKRLGRDAAMRRVQVLEQAAVLAGHAVKLALDLQIRTVAIAVWIVAQKGILGRDRIRVVVEVGDHQAFRRRDAAMHAQKDLEVFAHAVRLYAHDPFIAAWFCRLVHE